MGMGGSHLAADLIKSWNRNLSITIHKNYGLPKEDQGTLFIASSYSGNTEEVLDNFNKTLKKKLPLAVISTGGKLLELAKKHKIPYIQLPDTGIQPRSALGFGCKALLQLMHETKGLKEISELAKTLHPVRLEKQGQLLAKKMKNHIPMIYASEKNYGIAYNWKTKFNETGKTPAFWNVFPELNHNEMTAITTGFYYLIIKDDQDHPRIRKRIQILQKIYKKRDLPINQLTLRGKTRWEKIFSSMVLADWASYYTALQYHFDPVQIPMIEEFKKLIK